MYLQYLHVDVYNVIYHDKNLSDNFNYWVRTIYNHLKGNFQWIYLQQ